MTRWEYRIAEYEAETAGLPGKWHLKEPFGGGYLVVRSEFQLPALLVYAGDEGWELVAVQPISPDAPPSLWFKRPR